MTIQTLPRPDRRPPAAVGPGSASSTLRQSTIGILGLGPLGLQLARTLASLGTHRLVLDDAATVTHDDVRVGGYRLGDVGRPRPVSAARVLADSLLTSTAVSPGVLDGHDPGSLAAAVIVTHERIDPACTWRLVAQGVPHLLVTWGNGWLEVGPEVVPGRTTCLRCVDLHRADELAAPARGRHVGSGAEDPVLAVAGAALAAARTLELLAPGPSTRGLARTTTLALPDLTPAIEYWPVHPACGCA